MMLPAKLRQALGNDPATLAAALGVVSVFLYAIGYIAEKVHWNQLGYAEVPVEQVAFLYRGGLVALSCFAEALLYFGATVPASLERAAIVLILFLLVLSGTFLRGGEKETKWRRWLVQWRRMLPWVCFALLAALAWIELKDWPGSEPDLLYQAPAAAGTSERAFFRGYVGLLAVLVAYLWLSSPEVWKWTEKRWAERAQRRLLVAAATVLALLLPAVYGSFKYPLRYPIVLLHVAAPEDPKDWTPAPAWAQTAGSAPMALLGESESDLFLYRRTAETGSVLRVQRENVRMIKVLRIGHILEPSSFEPPRETDHEIRQISPPQGSTPLDQPSRRDVPDPGASPGATPGSPRGSPSL